MRSLAWPAVLAVVIAPCAVLGAAIESVLPEVDFTFAHWVVGVVSVAAHRSFVIADIPGLIEGASEGVGLGIQFLKHLQRTRLLLHIIDVAPMDDQHQPVDDAHKILQELQNYDESLYQKPRWLVLNKLDLLPEEEQEERCQAIIDGLNWQGPVYKISAINKQGVQQLCYDIMDLMEQTAVQAETDQTSNDNSSESSDGQD